VTDYVCFYCLTVKRAVKEKTPPTCCDQIMLDNKNEKGFIELFEKYTNTTQWENDLNSFMDPKTTTKIIQKGGWIGKDKESHARKEAWLKKTNHSSSKKIDNEELGKGEIEYRKLKQFFQNDFENIQKDPSYQNKNIDELINPYLAPFTQYYMHNATHRPPPGHGKVQQREYDKPLLYFRSQVDHPTGTGDANSQLKNKALEKFAPYPTGQGKQAYKNIYAGYYKSNASIGKKDLLSTKHKVIPNNQVVVKIEDYYTSNNVSSNIPNNKSFLASNLKYRSSINDYLSICGTRYVNFKVFTSKGHPNLYIELNNPPCADQNYDPTKTNHTEGWVNVILSFLGGLLNFLTNQAQTNIRVIRRQSFGFNRPTLTDAGQAVRLSFGNQPPSFVFIVESALEILDQVICLLEPAIAEAGLSSIENSRSSMGTTEGANVFRYAVRSKIEQLTLFDDAENELHRFIKPSPAIKLSKEEREDCITQFKVDDNDLGLDKLNNDPTIRMQQINEKLKEFMQQVKVKSATQKKYFAQENSFSQAFNHYMFNCVIANTLLKPFRNKEIDKYDLALNIFSTLKQSKLFNEYKTVIMDSIKSINIEYAQKFNAIQSNATNTNIGKEITQQQLQARKNRVIESMRFTGHVSKTEKVTDSHDITYYVITNVLKGKFICYLTTLLAS